MAGIAAAIDNNIGIVGVAPGARLWGVKVLDKEGSGYMSDVIAGVDWVTQNADEIEVANMSLRAIGSSSSLHEAIQSSVAAGVVYVVAAGNDEMDVYGVDGSFGTDDDVIPAAYPEVATISAMADSDGQSGGTGGDTSYGADDSFASFSNFSHSVISDNAVNSTGAAIDLLLPGVDIYSTYKDGGYATMSGTSMASPHGAGLAALYIAVNGRDIDDDGDHNSADVYDIRQALIDNGVAQNSTSGLATLNDPDDNPENIGWASSAVGDPPTVSWVNPEDGDTVSGNVTIQIAASATEDGTGTLTVEWRVDGGTWQTATYNSDTGYYEDVWPTTGVSDGDHTLDAQAIDSGGNTGNAPQITVTVNNEAGGMYVWDIGFRETGRHLKATVTILVDSDGDGIAESSDDPVSDATVYFTLTNQDTGESQNYAGITDSNGQVEFQWKFAPSGDYKAEVTDVTHSSYTWNPSLDADNPDHYTVE